MRILHVAAYAAPYEGGFIPMLTAIGTAARARGWDVELAFPETAAGRPWLDGLRDHGLAVRLLPFDRRHPAPSVLRGLVEPTEPTIVHTHFAGYDVSALAAVAGRRRGAVVWHIHGRLGDGAAVRMRNTFRMAVLGRRVARSLCVAPDTVTDLLSRGAPADRTLFFPNGIDTRRFAPGTDDQRRTARERLGVEPGAEVLLHYSWDWRIKGGDLFVDVVRRLHGRGRPVVGLTVGGGAAGRAAVAASGLDGRVRVLDQEPDVRPFHAAADAFLSTSRAEGMPFAVIEALSSGVPAVASNATKGHLAIGTDLAGYRIAPLDAGAFADHVEQLLDRPAAQAAAETDEVRRAMRERFDLEPWAQRLMGVYDEIRAGLER